MRRLLHPFVVTGTVLALAALVIAWEVLFRG